MCTTTRTRVAVLLAVAVVGLAACSGGETGEPDATTTVPGIVFGDGAIPDTVPADFPMPPQALIGQTLVDAANERTEVVVRAAAPVESLAQFYDVNLVTQGYVVDSSSGSSQDWKIDFRRDGLEGSITLIRVDDGITQYSIELTGS
jgi:hypothetical protein